MVQNDATPTSLGLRGLPKNLSWSDLGQLPDSPRSVRSMGARSMISEFEIETDQASLHLILAPQDIPILEEIWSLRDHEPASTEEGLIVCLVDTLVKNPEHLQNLNGLRGVLDQLFEKFQLFSTTLPKPQYDATLQNIQLINNGALHQDPSLKQHFLKNFVDKQGMAVFGGQGLPWFEELGELFKFNLSLNHFILQCSEILEYLAVQQTTHHYHLGLNASKWFSLGISPDEAYLSSSPVSFPYICLTQLAQLYKLMLTADLSPMELHQILNGTTGHSQGIVTSLILSSSTDIDSFLYLCDRAIRFMFWIGLRCQDVYENICGGEIAPILESAGVVTPMMSVNGLDVSVLKNAILKYNASWKSLPARANSESPFVYLSLVNGPRSAVVSGHPQSLRGFHETLKDFQADPSINQNRTPFSKRKLDFSMRFLSVSVPFHCEILNGVEDLVWQDLKEESLCDVFSSAELRIPVYSINTGENLQQVSDDTFVKHLIQLLCILPVDWRKAIQLTNIYESTSNLGSLLDFGPGKLSGIGRLSVRLLEGTGLQIVAVGSESSDSKICGLSSIIQQQSPLLEMSKSWKSLFMPKLKNVGEKLQISTRFTEVFGKPPIMVPGMTPSTAGEDFVAAVAKAGFHVELAGGGQHHEAMFVNRIKALSKMIPKGCGITVNLLFLNPYLWKFQFPLCVKLRREGYPIEGITIAAGIPSLDNANAIIQECLTVGITKVGFKPGTSAAISEVIRIAQSNPSAHIVLQWTGGQSGGHHSFENQHDPLLRMYSKIREVPNIILVCGGGIGNSVSASRFLNGSWSQEFGFPHMPVDAVLCGSRVMASLECPTSPAVKELIAGTSGVAAFPDTNWEKSFEGEAGGILTVLSELGEPIHKIANKGTRFWRKMDKEYFGLPDAKLEEKIVQDKDKIIDALNSSFQKPYFCACQNPFTKSWKTVGNLSEMSYTDVLFRLLHFFAPDNEWIDITFFSRFKALATRFLSRFSQELNGDLLTSAVQTLTFGAHPSSMLEKLSECSEYKLFENSLLSPDDEDFFLEVCMWPGKPVNFVPIIDKNLKIWFKKDSLWFSEDLRSVPDRDAERVAILHGPVAATYTTKVNEPVGEILSGILAGLEGFRAEVDEKVDVRAKVSFAEISHVLECKGCFWLDSLMKSDHVVRVLSSDEQLWKPNPMSKLLTPGPRKSFRSTYSDESLSFVEILVDGVFCCTLKVLAQDSNRVSLSLTLLHTIDEGSVSLTLRYDVVHSNFMVFILEEPFESHCEKMTDFYKSFWMRPVPYDTFFTEESLTSFASVIGDFKASRPVDYVVVCLWSVIMETMFNQSFTKCCDLSSLLHLSNEVCQTVPMSVWKSSLIHDGASSEILFVKETPSGFVVCIRAYVGDELNSLAEVISTFLIREYDPVAIERNCFMTTERSKWVLSLNNENVRSIFFSKDWHDVKEDIEEESSTLTFNLKSTSYASSVKLEGTISVKGKFIGSVKADSTSAVRFLRKYANKISTKFWDGADFTSSDPVDLIEMKMYSPPSNEHYSLVSRDWNPIHTELAFAEFAGLTNPIVHGLHSAARLRKIVEAVGEGTMASLQVEFQGKVLPEEVLSVQSQLIGVHNGRKCIKGRVFNNEELVLSFKGEILQEPCAYVFTGQGSAFVNMGQDLYGKSTVAKEIWDCAELFFQKKYGFSLMHIVRNNPKQLKVSIVDPLVRKSYQDIEVVQDGHVKKLFPDALNLRNRFLEFKSPSGLLFSTQFQQPAILLYEKSCFEDLKSQGGYQPVSFFAGHSLGEYAALACLLEDLSIDSLCEVVFLRGLTMQSAVERDSSGASAFGMVAASPSRVHKSFSDKELSLLVELIEKECGQLLQIVNYNVNGLQYVVAGHLRCLTALHHCMDALYKTYSFSHVENLVSEIVSKLPLQGINLTRGRATIPLQGIDVPFHSRLLQGGVSSFRRILQTTFEKCEFPVSQLVGRYIPNLIGTKFEMSHEFISTLQQVTNSDVLVNVLNNPPTSQSELCKQLVIELLSYQFASPVQWISTQQSILREGVSRFIEIGPTSVLLGFVRKSYPKSIPFELLWVGKDDDLETIQCKSSVFSKPSASADDSSKNSAVSASHPAQQESVVQPASFAVASSNAPPMKELQVDLSATQVIQVLCSVKLKLTLDNVPASKSIRQLCSGKSALQNEILGDLSAEFNSEPENAADIPLQTLGAELNKSYQQPGKIMNGLISKSLSRVLPGGYSISKVKNYLSGHWKASTSTVNGILIHCVVLSQSAVRMASELECNQWLDSAVSSFCQHRGVVLDLSSSSSSSGSNAAENVAVIDAKEFSRLKELLAKQRNAIDTFLTTEGGVETETEEIAVTSAEYVENELGEKFLMGIKPIFQTQQVRKFKSWWNWGRLESCKLLLDLESKATENLPQERVYEILNRGTADVVERISSFCSLETKDIRSPVWREFGVPSKPSTMVKENGSIVCSSSPRYARGFVDFISESVTVNSPTSLRLSNALMPEDENCTSKLTSVMEDMMNQSLDDGISFEGKVALITGAGPGSIGFDIVKNLLKGGAKVVVTTSNPSRSRWELFRQCYKKHCGKGSELYVIPFNAASSQDCQSLCQWFVQEFGSPCPDFFLPFAAIPEKGRDITRIDSHAELAHRAMLTNVIRMIGTFVSQVHNIDPSGQMHVLLPLSPNHGVFGGDGLYAESKLGLETLYRKWRSEGWGSFVSIVGVSIGWTRGTGLMVDNDQISALIEEQFGVRTFDASEISFAITNMMSAEIVEQSMCHPIHADFSGGFAQLEKSGSSFDFSGLRMQLSSESNRKKAVFEDRLEDLNNSKPNKSEVPETAVYFRLPFPALPTVKPQSLLEGMLDLTKVVVVAGFGEIGPWGNSRTRWEWELNGAFSTHCAIELARSMNLIKYGKAGRSFSWIDVASGAPVKEADIAIKYWNIFKSKCGIRPIEPALFDGYEPSKKLFLQQTALAVDMEPFEISSQEEAAYLKTYHGDRLDVSNVGDRVVAKLKQGAVIYIPKNIPFSRQVAGQLPTGWSPALYGIPESISKQVDPVTQYALAATMEAFLSAGISDPYELYEHVHISEVGNSIGGGMGGMKSLRGVFKERSQEVSLSSDVLQETFINTTAAWVNMLLVSSCGPIKPPVAACATAAISVDIAVDTILSGKAKVMIAGGTEDFGEEGSFEFANMKATSNSLQEFALGREADEHCRPSTTSRGGFMESQGAGIQILMTAELALKLGVPIYALVVGSSTATDRQGRSVPAPGKGILSTCSSTACADVNRYLDVQYRRECFNRDFDMLKSSSSSFIGGQTDEFLEKQFAIRKKSLQTMWGHEFCKGDGAVSPLMAQLATFGFSANDIDVCSFHGTGTKANDLNESEVVSMQLKALHREKEFPVLTVFQKWMTGHPKGAAAAWMLNGLIQSVLSGQVPGNRNADDVDEKLSKFTNLLYSDETVNFGRPLSVGFLHSFGFGQAGAEVVISHPNKVFELIDQELFSVYQSKRAIRLNKANRHWQEALMAKRSYLPIKEHAPFSDDNATAAYLSRDARATYDSQSKSYRIQNCTIPDYQPAKMMSTSSSPFGVGIDMEDVELFEGKDDIFIARNFTKEEVTYCTQKSARPLAMSYAGKWSAKEAVFKAICSCVDIFGESKIDTSSQGGAGAPLKEIEITHFASGSPKVVLYGRALEIAQAAKIDRIAVSISYSNKQVIAQAQAFMIPQKS